jgi:hypothetical protein
MVNPKSTGPRTMHVFVRPGSKAELACRNYAAGQTVEPREPLSHAEVIAHGFAPHTELNLVDHHGKIIRDLVYANFFVGGAAWKAQDMQNIDDNLEKAMKDQGLNNVLLQYFRGAANVTSTFHRPSTVLPDHPTTISQPEVEDLVKRLHDSGKLAGFDFANTVFNFMLSQGTVLTIDDGSGDKRGAKKSKGHGQPVEEEASSLEGLGGFHGSVQFGAVTVYYAVGVFSEGNNGIVAFDQPWKNVVATFYHELVEARTDADVEDNRVAWVNNENPSSEIGDIPMSLAGNNLGKVMKEVTLADGSVVPIQLMWSNAVGGPEGPIPVPHPAH